MKKSVKIIIIAVVVLALGAGGYFIYTNWGSSQKEGTVFVQPVSEIVGIGPVGVSNSYAGVVEAKEVIEINPDRDLTIKDCYVKSGDAINAGDKLFSYDVDELSLQREQLLIDIASLQSTVATDTEQIEKLNKQLERAKEKDIYELKLELQTVELRLKKTKYELSDKQKKAADIELVIQDSVVLSPVSGKIKSVRSDSGSSNPFGYMDSTGSNAYITIVSGSDFCVKGTVSEQTVFTLYEGMTVTVQSRTNANEKYLGTIYRINTGEPIQDNNQMYYDGAAAESASKYAFYVELNDVGQLLMGQHVYIKLGDATSNADGGWKLPSYYLIGEGDEHFVFAEGANGRIEKRTVTLGEHDEMTDSYEIVSGLELSDKIAFPDETVQEGMRTTTTRYSDDASMQNGSMDFTGEDVDFMGGDMGVIDEGMDMGGDIEPVPMPIDEGMRAEPVAQAHSTLTF